MHFAICSSVLGIITQIYMPNPQLGVMKALFHQSHNLLTTKLGLAVRAADTDNWVSVSEGTLHQGVGGSTFNKEAGCTCR